MGKENVEDIVPLLPMQQAFLWHALADDMQHNTLQLRCVLQGEIQLPLLEVAWQQVVSSHQALRSTVHWQELSSPVQVIHRHVVADITVAVDYNARQNSEPETPETQPDLTPAPTAEPTASITLTKAPTHKLHLSLQAADACHVVWTISHVLLDGWSCALVINDWLRIYDALMQKQSTVPSASLSLKKYSRWLANQDKQRLQDHWESVIPSKTPLATPLPYKDLSISASGIASHQSITQRLSIEDTAILHQACRVSGVSLNTVIQAALALVLTPENQLEPLAFSTTVSGRQSDVAGIDTLVGMLINVIPVYMHFDPRMTLRDWLQLHQSTFFQSLPHAHVNLQDVIDITARKCKGQRLSPNCLLVVENQSAALSSETLKVSDYRSGIVSDMDLTFVVIPGEQLEFDVRFRADKLNAKAITDTVNKLVALVAKLPALFERSVSACADYRLKHVSCTRCPTTPPSKQQATTPVSIRADSLQLQPQPMIEQQLRIIWTEVLGEDCHGDNGFFDAGGSSLQAARLFELIRQRLGVRLPMTCLFSSPTLNELVARISKEQTEPVNTGVVLINGSGSRPPLFIPFEQSDMLIYRHLVDALGSDQPVYGLQTSQTPVVDSDEIAGLADTMIRLQPDGPYLLAGLSGSGLSAWLIAQALQSRGLEVSMLALLDSYGPRYPQLPNATQTVISLCKQHIRHGARFGSSYLYRKKNLLLKRLVQACRHKLSGQARPSPSQIDIPEANEFAKRMTGDRRQAVEFARSVMDKQPFHEKMMTHCAVRLARLHYRSFHLNVELLLLMQGLLLQYALRHNLNPLQIQATGYSTAFRNALQRYQDMYNQLRPLKSHVVYLMASESAAVGLPDPLNGWRDLMPDDVRVHTIAGNHLSMLTPGRVESMAACLKDEMVCASEAFFSPANGRSPDRPSICGDNA